MFDRERDRYLLVETGWQNGYRIYGTPIINSISSHFGDFRCIQSSERSELPLSFH
jgi:hypothetical protein